MQLFMNWILEPHAPATFFKLDTSDGPSQGAARLGKRFLGVTPMREHVWFFACSLRQSSYLQSPDESKFVLLGVEGMSKKEVKVDRARRNALKATGLVLGVVVAAGLPKTASAQTLPSWICRFFPSLCRPRPGQGPGGGGACFARGTLVRTRDGYRPVETLAAGDEVAVRFQGFAKIKAMVSHTLNSVAGRWDGVANLPVVVRRGALGENMPDRDLCLTDQHAVYVDGYLMKVRDLVNGTSIAFMAADGHDSLDFFNIELDRNDILDVQGAPCESLYRPATERCAPLLGFDGGRSELRSRLRSVASIVRDRRQPIDIIRDKLEERGYDLARAA